ncbi:ribosomal protein S18-alanine N-acetyltransferase [Komagataeibacter rhaeticus]|uniref:ribosomal protein S18-alanine N-acetyltransferase n=1 Tax=Komagataeibacter rhaeticus TaxID=215221 RepID=UPI0004D45AD6|nr:ribosomal protein S18-alanine N-acetyltransferase [Komagataeibacter rhaeticus]KDU95047.1 alanine acetyltransferase [Komagataeibacter rhaeticus AF1]MBL7241023.1 ribosomal protein S18-alanine N-acetyltransferase [Komagataeibacter rhaeticus]GBQ13743.1 ribosomal protein alanine acetyltransferase [Komagataeibacter rhaeticus DSM 16663]
MNPVPLVPITPYAAMLARIHAAAFAPLHRWDARAMQALIDMPGVLTVLAPEELDGEASGFIMARMIGDEAEILTFAVNPVCQRRGIGRDLLARCVRQAASAGVVSVFLEVARDNAGALGLYHAAGFAPVGLRRNYYPDGTDACVMQLRI